MDGDAYDPTTLLDPSADEGTIQQRAQAMAAALRRQNALGQVLQLTGHSTAAPLGQSMQDQATGGTGQIVGELERQPMMNLQRQEAAKNQAESQQLQAGLALQKNPAYTQRLVQTLARMGQKVTPEQAASLGSLGLERSIGIEEKVPKPTVVPLGSTLVQPGQSGPAGGGSIPFSDDVLNQRADYLNQTGTHMQGLPRGAAGMMAAQAIEQRAIDRKAAGLSGSSLAGSKAGFESDSKSLAKLQQQSDSVDAFEGTALKNLDAFLGVAKNINDSGIPILNKPIRAISDQLGGSPLQAQFNTARQVAIQEIGKVLGSAVAGGVVTDSQRHDVEGLMRGDMTLGQLQSVAETLKGDMANRKGSLAQQLATIKGRIGGQQPSAQPAPTGKKVFNPATGKVEMR